jgi:CubicO group peptidase (beta-lactamase class C family)
MTELHEGRLQSALDAAIDTALADDRAVGAVVCVSQHGITRYARAAGWSDREARRPMQWDSVFRLASVSKPFVTVAVLRAIAQGILALDEPVTRWLPFFAPPLPDGRPARINVYHLLTHTAGLDYGLAQAADGPYRQHGVSDGMDRVDGDLEANLQRLATLPLGYAPSHGWGYSLAIDVLGAVLARAMRMSLPAAIRVLVGEPLGLTDIGFHVEARQRDRLTTAYFNGPNGTVAMSDDLWLPFPDAPEQGVRFAPSRIVDPHAYASGGAGMAGTAADVMALLDTLRAADPAWLPPAISPIPCGDLCGIDVASRGPGWGFGYGAGVLVDPVQAGTPQSPGTLAWGGVYGHHWFIDPTHDLVACVLTNTAYEGMNGRLTVDVRDAVYAALG